MQAQQHMRSGLEDFDPFGATLRLRLGIIDP